MAEQFLQNSLQTLRDLQDEVNQLRAQLAILPFSDRSNDDLQQHIESLRSQLLAAETALRERDRLRHEINAIRASPLFNPLLQLMQLGKQGFCCCGL